MANMWMVRAQGGEWLPLFTEKGLVALGWTEIGDVTGKKRSWIKDQLSVSYPESIRSVGAWAGVFDNFVNVMKTGDTVITYDSSSRQYYIGKITGEYQYDPHTYPENPHFRTAEWLPQTLSRDLLSSSARFSLGSLSTVFRVSPDTEAEIAELLHKKPRNHENAEEKVAKVQQQTDELFRNSVETLKDKILAFNFDQMEDLVREILLAMGYNAVRTPKGKDRGVDVFASRDGLGLEGPRIFIEVKHHKEKIGAPDIRSFIAGRNSQDRCLYVSTSGFSLEAKYEAERSSVPLTLIDLDLLAELIIRHYDNFRVEGRLMLPLRKIYLPE